jgi:hypothetical protein
VRAIWGPALALALASCRLGFDQIDRGDGSPGGVALQYATSATCSNCTTVASDTIQVPASSLLIALVYTCAPGDSNCPTPILADTAQNGWSAPLIVGSVGHGANYLWYSCAATPGPEQLTVTNASTQYSILLQVHVVAGIAPTGCLDATGTATGNSVVAAVTTSVAVAQPNEYVVAFFAHNASSAQTYSAGAGYVQVQTSTSPRGETAFSEAPAVMTGLSGLQTAAATNATQATSWDATIATFLPAN